MSATLEERVAEILPCVGDVPCSFGTAVPAFWCSNCKARPAVLALVKDYERDDENYLWLQDECNRRGALVAELAEALKPFAKGHATEAEWRKARVVLAKVKRC